jgi:hypothetical protein
MVMTRSMHATAAMKEKMVEFSNAKKSCKNCEKKCEIISTDFCCWCADERKSEDVVEFFYCDGRIIVCKGEKYRGLRGYCPSCSK